MQIAKINPGAQKEIRELIQVMIERKTDYVEMPEDDFTKAVVEMAKLHTNLVRVQSRSGRSRR